MSSATERPSRAPSTTKSVMSATASGWLSLTPRSSRRRATIAAIAIRSLSFSRGVRFMGFPHRPRQLERGAADRIVLSSRDASPRSLRTRSNPRYPRPKERWRRIPKGGGWLNSRKRENKFRALNSRPESRLASAERDNGRDQRGAQSVRRSGEKARYDEPVESTRAGFDAVACSLERSPQIGQARLDIGRRRDDRRQGARARPHRPPI